MVYYRIVLQITSIVQICFSLVISAESIDELRNAIEAHLRLFKEVFPDVTIAPKMHYMLHIPRQIMNLGPLVRHCCTRFEARHKYFKELAREQNFKNISLSLAERYSSASTTVCWTIICILYKNSLALLSSHSNMT